MEHIFRATRTIKPPKAEYSPFIRPKDVGSKVAWQMLVRDGYLKPMYGQVAVRANQKFTPQLRAQALRPHVPADFALAGISAAWIYAGTTELHNFELAFRKGANHKHAAQLNLKHPSSRVWSSADLETVTETVEQTKVTNPHRTIIDLATRHDREVALAWMANMAVAGIDLAATLRYVDLKNRVIGRSRIREILQTAIEMAS